MTIHLPNELESFVRAEVVNGHFASTDDAVAEMVRDYLQRNRTTLMPTQLATIEEASPSARGPIWAEIQELTADVPEDEWDKLPTDLAEQHDHYLYGTPKRRAE